MWLQQGRAVFTILRSQANLELPLGQGMVFVSFGEIGLTLRWLKYELSSDVVAFN